MNDEELQRAVEAALRKDRESRQAERAEKSASWGGWIVAFVLIGLPLIFILLQQIDGQNDRLIDCGGLTYTGDLKEHPGCRDLGPVP